MSSWWRVPTVRPTAHGSLSDNFFEALYHVRMAQTLIAILMLTLALTAAAQTTAANRPFWRTVVMGTHGAVAAARLTNISLLSLAALKEATAHELLARHLSQLEAQIIELAERLRYLQIEVPHATLGTVFRARPGANLKSALEGRVWLGDLLSALQDMKVSKYRYSIPSVFPVSTARLVKLANPQILLIEGKRLVAEVGTWYAGQVARTERAARLLAPRPSISIPSPD